MYRLFLICLFLTIALLLAISCSNQGTDGVIPSDNGQPEREPGGTICAGFWQVVIDGETGTIDAVDLRSTDLIVNVLGFLEPPALKGLTIGFGTLVIDNPTIDVDVIITHPIPDAQFMGFDVRGVVFGPEVANADGLTVVCSPEFFTGVPFGYINGLLGTPDSIANYEGVAGYKYFCDGLGKNDDLAEFMSDPANLAKRGVFSQNPNKNSRHYTLDWSDSEQKFFVFNYAVYANYNWPVGPFPYDIDDFNISTANSAEAFCCKVNELSNSLYYVDGSGGGTISLETEIWDWQGNIAGVTIESVEPGVIDNTGYSYDNAGNTIKSTIFGFTDIPAAPTHTGKLDILITATDPVTFGEAWFMGLLPKGNQLYNDQLYNCWIYTVDVTGCPVPAVDDIDPWHAKQDTFVDDMLITGAGFIDGAGSDVRLKRTGEADIVATDVHFLDYSTITADLFLTGAEIGAWDVVITNGCGEEGIEQEGFWVTDPNCPVPTINGNPGIDPYEGFQGEIVHVTIYGTNFVEGPLKEVRLTDAPDGQGTKDDIICDITSYTETKLEADFDITTAAIGVWNVRVTNGCGEFVDKGPAQGGGFRVWCPVPTVDEIDPDEGEQNKIVTVVFTGDNFMPDLMTYPESARLNKNGVWIDGDINYDDTDNTSLSVDFSIPEDAEVGPWDIYIRNSCGTGDSFPIYGGFHVTGCNPPELNMWDAIVPGNVDGGLDFHAEINGQKLFQGDDDFEVTLEINDGAYVIEADNETWIDDTKVECDFSIPGDAPWGDYDLHVVNGCGDEGEREEAFSVYPVITSISPNKGAQGEYIPGAIISGWLFQSGFDAAGIARITTWPDYEAIYGLNPQFIDTNTVSIDLDLSGATIADDWAAFLLYGVVPDDAYAGGSFEVTPP